MTKQKNGQETGRDNLQMRIYTWPKRDKKMLKHHQQTWNLKSSQQDTIFFHPRKWEKIFEIGQSVVGKRIGKEFVQCWMNVNGYSHCKEQFGSIN